MKREQEKHRERERGHGPSSQGTIIVNICPEANGKEQYGIKKQNPFNQHSQSAEGQEPGLPNSMAQSFSHFFAMRQPCDPFSGSFWLSGSTHTYVEKDSHSSSFLDQRRTYGRILAKKNILTNSIQIKRLHEIVCLKLNLWPIQVSMDLLHI